MVTELARGEMTSDLLYERPPGPGLSVEAGRRALAGWRYLARVDRLTTSRQRAVDAGAAGE